MAQKATVTQQDITQGLRELGLKEGDVIGVHSSLSSFGYVEGGAEAIVDSLLETVGEAGTVVMPTYSTNREAVPRTPQEKAQGVNWKYKVFPFDPDKESCWTGTIPDTFWRRPAACRSLHPTHSLAAIGSQAGELIGGWDQVMAAGGYILLLGVTLRCCTALHLAEERVELPEFIMNKLAPPQKLIDKYPAPIRTLSWLAGGWCGEGPREQQWDIGFGPYPDFLLMEGPCQEQRIMQIGRIGEAVVRLVRLSELIDLYAECLRSYPEAFYHGCVPQS